MSTIAEKLTQIAENTQRVYNAGYEKGIREGDGCDHNILPIVEIVPNFANGDFTESLPDNYYAHAAKILKPVNLKPENIAKDVNIAGVIGTHEGGSVEGTAKVIFCNYDGTELYSRPVFIGDDCPDPIAQNKLDTPTRDSDVQYHYTFNGWSTTQGGTASSTALKNITADKTVYAVYSTSLVYYTVRFYDGDTLMQESQVAYGGTATAPSTDRDGYDFVGWTPSNFVIKADTDFYGEWVEKVDPYVLYEYDENGNAVKVSFMYFKDIVSTDLTNEKTIQSVDFSGSPNLATIGNDTFDSCSALTEIDIPEGVTYIGNHAFSSCPSLTKVSLPSTLTSAGEYTFYSCSAVKEVHITDLAKYCAVEWTGVSWLFNKGASLYLNGEKVTRLVIPEGVTRVGAHAFNELSITEGVVIPNSLTSVGANGFMFQSGSTGGVYINTLAQWYDLEFANLGASPLFKMGNLYVNGELITDIVIPNDMVTIGDFTFCGCTGLTSITIHEGVTSIGGFAFQGCTGLTSITIPSSVTSMGNRTFYGCTGLTSITIHEGVTSIASETFQGCTGLTSITIPSSVTSIGSSAFRECTKLTSITIHEGVTSIGYRAFYKCTGLTSISLPASIQSIDYAAFERCDKLVTINVPWAEGEVANAPWGATKATITYNYTG